MLLSLDIHLSYLVTCQVSGTNTTLIVFYSLVRIKSFIEGHLYSCEIHPLEFIFNTVLWGIAHFQIVFF